MLSQSLLFCGKDRWKNNGKAPPFEEPGNGNFASSTARQGACCGGNYTPSTSLLQPAMQSNAQPPNLPAVQAALNPSFQQARSQENPRSQLQIIPSTDARLMRQSSIENRYLLRQLRFFPHGSEFNSVTGQQNEIDEKSRMAKKSKP